MATAPEQAASGEALDAGLQLVVPGRGLEASRGWEWIKEGWPYFTRSPLMWIVSLVILFVISLMLGIIPFIGMIAFQLLAAVFAGGFIAACRSIERGGEFELEHVFAGFKARFVPLLIVGLIYVAAMLALLLVFFIPIGLSMLPAFLSGDPAVMSAAMAGSAIAFLLGSLVLLAAFIPLVAAYWFAPALVMVHDMAPIAAMKASFFGCFRNFVPFLLYSLIMFPLGFIAALPLGLGLLVWIPLLITSNYVAYRQIFTTDAAPVPPKPTMV